VLGEFAGRLRDADSASRLRSLSSCCGLATCWVFTLACNPLPSFLPPPQPWWLQKEIVTLKSQFGFMKITNYAISLKIWLFIVLFNVYYCPHAPE